MAEIPPAMLRKKALVIVPVAAVILLAVACKKRQAFNSETAQVAVDNQMILSATESAIAESQLAVMDQSLMRGKSSGGGTLKATSCGVELDTVSVGQGIVTINYTGASCGSVRRTGKVILRIQNYPLVKWKQKGSRMIVEFSGYKVTRLSDGKSVQVDGSIVLTNESGKGWYELSYQYEPVVSCSAYGTDLKADFDGEGMVFHMSRKYTFTFSVGHVFAQVDGTESVDGKERVESWGKNREGQPFVSWVEAALFWNTECGAGILTSGQLRMKADEKYYEFTSRFGLDSDGNDQPYGPGNCPYGWKTTWSYSGDEKNFKFAY
jgi:hypothetical protein